MKETRDLILRADISQLYFGEHYFRASGFHPEPERQRTASRCTTYLVPCASDLCSFGCDSPVLSQAPTVQIRPIGDALRHGEPNAFFAIETFLTVDSTLCHLHTLSVVEPRFFLLVVQILFTFELVARFIVAPYRFYLSLTTRQLFVQRHLTADISPGSPSRRPRYRSHGNIPEGSSGNTPGRGESPTHPAQVPVRRAVGKTYQSHPVPAAPAAPTKMNGKRKSLPRRSNHLFKMYTTGSI